MPHACMLRRCTDPAGRAPLGQIGDYAAAKDLIAVQEPLLGAAPGNLRRSPGVLGLVHAARTPVAGDLTAHHRRLRPIERAIRTWDKPASNPTILALQSWVWVEASRPPAVRGIRSLWLVGLG